jgi:hypothetical protein
VNPSSHNSRKEILFRIALLAGGLVVSAVVLEVALRVIGFSYSNYGVPDPVRGWAFRPNVEAVVKGENPKGIPIRINSQGFRDREHTPAKPPGTFRVAVLGDSYGEASQVQESATFWAVMERKLGACQKHVEVLSFGIGGYGTAQEFLTMQQQAWKYQPDVVLLAMTTGNDIRDNLRALSQQPVSPYYVYRDGKLVLDDSFRSLIRFSAAREWEAALARRFRLVQLLRASYDRIRQMREVNQDGREAGLDDRVYVEPQDEVWREAWKVTEGLLRMMAEEVRHNNASFWIATLTNGIQVHPDPAVKRKFMHDLGVDTLFYPNDRIRAFGRREGIPVITLGETMAEYAEKNKKFLHGFEGGWGEGHWNEEGHRLAGETIASQLCAGLSAGGLTR